MVGQSYLVQLLSTLRNGSITEDLRPLNTRTLRRLKSFDRY
ncbi:hypothetical protein [Leptolyngbya sp. FACHB-321]|nr:hypothetical protein [Leptolyngbya sp. FACHB-321]